MLRPPSLLPALVAVAAAVTVAVTVAPVPPVPVAASSAPVAGRLPAAPAVENDDPLQITIDRLTPGEIPRRGKVRMLGTVTNVSDERWRAVNVHAFVGFGPMTTSAELAQAREVPPEAEVGTRIFIPGTFDDIGGLDPGETSRFEVELRRDQIPAEAPGVYWFGAHALGNTTEARDDVADGRARTFLPLIPSSTRDTVDTSVVIPLRRGIRHLRNGQVAGEEGWARDLGPGGFLGELVDLGSAAGSRPVTWLVDPAVPGTVQDLVDGNGPRSLAGSRRGGPTDGEESPSDDTPTATPEPAPSPPGPATEPGREWLEGLGGVLEGGNVLALPYGDVDVSAAQDHDPASLATARQRAGDVLAPLDVPTIPAVAPPSGHLSTDALEQLPDGTTTLLGEAMLPEGVPDGPVDVGDRGVLFTAADVAQGGPGPDDPLGTVAIRQRILAEAAVRLVDERRTPLVVVLPSTWTPGRPGSFWRGLGVPWVNLTDPTTVISEEQVALEDLDYPPEQRAAELPAASFESATALVEAGETLANVLSDNDVIDRDIRDQVLAALSYGSRRDAERVRETTERSRAWVERRADAVRVDVPPGVTLSSATGKFGLTLTNRLDQPVTISLRAITDASLSVDTPGTIDLAPRGSQSLLLNARAGAPGVHYVRLVVTDDAGAPLGSTATLPVRSAQVSEVIWLILGVGVGLLFLAIAVRLVRRIRSERA